MENLSLTASMAFIFGVFHALEPGHGKTALLTYVASGKRSWKEGVIISTSSAMTHSISVVIIAFISHTIATQTGVEGYVSKIGGILGYASGGLIFSLGLYLIYRHKKGISKKACSSCEEGHGHTQELTKGKFLTSGLLGIATGLIPCPTIVVAYLSGVTAGGSLLGVQSVMLFALGMCVSLLGVVTFCSLSGEKIVTKLSKSKFSIKWDLIQGCLFVAIGFITAFYH